MTLSLVCFSGAHPVLLLEWTLLWTELSELTKGQAAYWVKPMSLGPWRAQNFNPTLSSPPLAGAAQPKRHALYPARVREK